VTNRDLVARAVARAWTHPQNVGKPLDAVLALSIVDELAALGEPHPDHRTVEALKAMLDRLVQTKSSEPHTQVASSLIQEGRELLHELRTRGAA
jgi:hypothetical protein